MIAMVGFDGKGACGLVLCVLSVESRPCWGEACLSNTLFWNRLYTFRIISWFSELSPPRTLSKVTWQLPPMTLVCSIQRRACDKLLLKDSDSHVNRWPEMYYLYIFSR